MRILLLGAALASLGAPNLSRAEGPHVPGYERFHRGEASPEGGAVLYSELGCANCHGDSPVAIARMGPSLAGISKRVERNWVLATLRDPGHGREGSTMPSLFDRLPEDERNEKLEAIAAWLGSLEPDMKLKSSRHVNAERGSAVYHERGCVACHPATPDFHPPGDAGAGGTVALPDFAKKTSLPALTRTLLDTAAFRPDGRMPHFLLEEQDYIDVAAHLLDFQSSDPRTAAPVERWPKTTLTAARDGLAIATEMNCASCHDLPGIEPAAAHGIGEDFSRGESSCLSERPTIGLPRYALDDEQRESLALYLANRSPVSEEKSAETTLAAMNCYACHARDGLGGPLPETDLFFIGDEGLGDSGRLPPPLTGIGDKLQRDALESIFAGAEAGRVRSYLKTEMPSYPSHAGTLADWFETIDARPKAPSLAAVTDEEIEAGRTLLGTQGGVNCITCHRWDEQPSLGIQGIDISALDKRLRPEWFRRYLLDPASYRPGTLMPPLWPGGHSMIPAVLGGDTEKQISAIWTFIARGEGLPPGFPDHASGAFELVPQDGTRPIVQRAFVEGAGTRAILVGFPAGVHLAYDGAKARPALAWQGRFFDAYNTWFSRFPPFERPLAEEIHPFGETAPDNNARFIGFELDAAGNPTFLSQLPDGREIRDHYEGLETGILKRTLSWDGGDPPPSSAHPEGATVKSEDGSNHITFTYHWQ